MTGVVRHFSVLQRRIELIPTIRKIELTLLLLIRNIIQAVTDCIVTYQTASMNGWSYGIETITPDSNKTHSNEKSIVIPREMDANIVVTRIRTTGSGEGLRVWSDIVVSYYWSYWCNRYRVSLKVTKSEFASIFEELG